jgi:hypothetical protein
MNNKTLDHSSSISNYDIHKCFEQNSDENDDKYIKLPDIDNIKRQFEE